ncbi:hypothetical protein XaC1_190 [Xanthomonas phage XaC1]|nr:hypothetical protein XaC1_190 [Xanthomonas phage XaC1]
MKQIFALVILCLAFTLTGCDDRNDVEVALFEQCSKANKIECITEYRSTLKSLDCDGSQCNPKETPFARSIDVFKIDDRMFKIRHPEMKSISEIYFESTGNSLYSGAAVIHSSSTDDVKKVDNTFVLSPQMYDELINAVRTCNRATISATQFPIGSKLSPEDYNKVMNIILDCKQYQLDEAINKK